jgi:hypothetical protein
VDSCDGVCLNTANSIGGKVQEDRFDHFEELCWLVFEAFRPYLIIFGALNRVVLFGVENRHGGRRVWEGVCGCSVAILLSNND